MFIRGVDEGGRREGRNPKVLPVLGDYEQQILSFPGKAAGLVASAKQTTTYLRPASLPPPLSLVIFFFRRYTSILGQKVSLCIILAEFSPRRRQPASLIHQIQLTQPHFKPRGPCALFTERWAGISTNHETASSPMSMTRRQACHTTLLRRLMSPALVHVIIMWPIV